MNKSHLTNGLKVVYQSLCMKQLTGCKVFLKKSSHQTANKDKGSGEAVSSVPILIPYSYFDHVFLPHKKNTEALNSCVSAAIYIFFLV